MTTKATKEAETDEVEGEVTELEPERALVVAAPQQHLVVGVGALAAMDEGTFQRNLDMLIAGQERLQILTDKLLIEGQDYGKVPNIRRPFLQKPGAEKLGNFYGLAVRFDSVRVVGDGVLAPQLSYQTSAFVHLRDFDGPVVAQGYGEANSWEPRYRYRDEQPTCPQCQRPDLIRRKNPPALEGKWQCPNWKGGCGTVFEPGDPRISTGGKVENQDPYELANTLVKMSCKRAHVDGILRATGTSGFFTQDEDSPSVRQQSGDAGDAPPPEEPPAPTKVEGVEVERGGKSVAPTKPQIDRLRAISKEKDLGPDRIAVVVERLTGKKVDLGDGDRRAQGLKLVAFLTSELTSDDLGSVIHAMETGEVAPAATEAAATPAMESAL